MTYMDNSQTNPRPPAGDVQPVPVHITSIAAGAGVALGQAPAAAPPRRRVTRFSTFMISETNSIQNILPRDDNRIRALVIVHSTIGSGTSSNSFGWLGPTYGIVQSAADSHGEGYGEGMAYISAGGTINVPFEFWGGDAVWAALDSNATTAMTLTVIADYEVPG